MTVPNQNLFRRGLARSDLTLIVHETHWTETARLADLVLPAPSFLEKEDIVIPDSHNLVQFSHQVTPPVTDSRHEIQVMQELAKRLDLKEPWLYEDALSVVTEVLADAFEDGEIKELLNGEEVILENQQGRLQLEAVISDSLPAGVVWCPKEAPDLNGTPQNCLTSSRPQSLGKGPRFNSTTVRLFKA